MMRAACKARLAALGLALTMLAGCSAGTRAQCTDGFCLPADVVIIGRERQSDFTLYQLTWRGEQIGLYAGDYPMFDVKRAVPHAVPLDPAALLIAGGGNAELRMLLGKASPRYLHLSGRCARIDICNLGQLARAITRSVA